MNKGYKIHEVICTIGNFGKDIVTQPLIRCKIVSGGNQQVMVQKENVVIQSKALYTLIGDLMRCFGCIELQNHTIFVVTEKEKMMEEEKMSDKLEIDWGPKITTTSVDTAPRSGKWCYYNGRWYRDEVPSEKSKESNSQELSLMRIANALDHIAKLMDKYAEWLHIK